MNPFAAAGDSSTLLFFCCAGLNANSRNEHDARKQQSCDAFVRGAPSRESEQRYF
jgi:hypothetical protein